MNNVIAIIVAYDPELDALTRLLQAITPQVRHVVVVDNGSRMCMADWLAGQGAGTVQSIIFKENRGIAAAQNAGIAWAREHGGEFVLLLDQDSTPAADMVCRLREALASLVEQGERPAAVGPAYRSLGEKSAVFGIREEKGRVRRIPIHREGIFPTDTIIASGSLVPLSVLDVVGEMEAAFFIDAVDTEWCLRAKAAGFGVFLVTGAHMTHAIGEQRRRLWLGRWRQVPIHRPRRSYYISRNNLLLCFRPYVSRAWARYIFSWVLKRLAYFLLFGPERLAHVSAILRGIRDGWRMRRMEQLWQDQDVHF